MGVFLISEVPLQAFDELQAGEQRMRDEQVAFQTQQEEKGRLYKKWFDLKRSNQ